MGHLNYNLCKCMQLGCPVRRKNNETTENLRFIKNIRGEVAASPVQIILLFRSQSSKDLANNCDVMTFTDLFPLIKLEEQVVAGP